MFWETYIELIQTTISMDDKEVISHLEIVKGKLKVILSVQKYLPTYPTVITGKLQNMQHSVII